MIYFKHRDHSPPFTFIQKTRAFYFSYFIPRLASLTDTDILILVLSDNVNRSRNGSGDNREEEGELESKIKAEAIV